MSDLEALAGACDWFAAGAEMHGSPFYAVLVRHLATDVRAGGVTWRVLAGVGADPIEDAVPIRLLGGVHLAVLRGELPDLAAHFPTVGGDGDADAAFEALTATLEDPPPVVLDALTRPPQTNEVGRSASLVVAFLTVARQTGLPLRLRELGASGGLNLLCDRYRYEQGGQGWGDPSSPVRFTDLWGGVPPFEVAAVIADRRGCDRDPIDAASDAGAQRLLSYVWPGQDQRFSLLAGALDVARGHDPGVEQAEADVWLDTELAELVPGTATVVYHSIVWPYFPAPTRDRILDTLADAGARATTAAPLAWVRLEAAESGFPAELRVALWDGSEQSGRDRLLATSLFQGGEIDLIG